MIDLHVVYYSMPGLLLSRKVCDMQVTVKLMTNLGTVWIFTRITVGRFCCSIPNNLP